MKDHPTVARLLSGRCRQVLRQRTRVLATADGDAIHDLRVATRRLQEALEFLAPALPGRPARRLGRRARRIRRELGTIRNLDVLRRLVARHSRGLSAAQRGVIAPLAKRLAQQAAMIRGGGLALPGIGKRVRELQSKLILPADFAVRERARRVVMDRTSEMDAALEKARTGDPAALHALRIAVKRYRYTLEILERTGTRRAGPALTAARRVQTRLGELHDLDVLLELLPRAAAPSARSLAALFARRRLRLLNRARRALDGFDPKRLTRAVLGERVEGAAA